MRLRKQFLTASMIVGASLALNARADTYNIDPTHSQVLFKVKHLSISTVSGRFDTFSGTLDMDEGEPKSLKLAGTINAASINTNNKKRDDHLRNEDFLDVKSHAEITFETAKTRDRRRGRIRIFGNLKMRGKPRPVVLEGTISDAVQDPWGNTRIAVNVEGKIDRTKFGIAWNKEMETGGLVIGEEVTIALELEATLVVEEKTEEVPAEKDEKAAADTKE
tara:strand:- start:4 stop:663 length:660 start_codon:yes stop_codon:yes gene_type:complete